MRHLQGRKYIFDHIFHEFCDDWNDWTSVIRFVTEIIVVYYLLDKVTVNLQFLVLRMSEQVDLEVIL